MPREINIYTQEVIMCLVHGAMRQYYERLEEQKKQIRDEIMDFKKCIVLIRQGETLESLDKKIKALEKEFEKLQ